MATPKGKTNLTAEELDEKLAAAGVPEVGATWAAQAAQIGAADDDDAEDDEAEVAHATSLIDTVTAPPDVFESDGVTVKGENADSLSEPSYERTEHDSEPQPEEDFDAVEVKCQLQNVSYRPRSNGLGIFMQFETALEVVPAIARIKGADLVFDKLLLGHGATISSISTRPDADGNLKTRINLMLPESELMRADPRPLITKVGTLRLEPAQMTFDLTSRAK